ncbi:hypothetical protein N7528_000415 [Penicillium herquei]|nr:hypothetical protein N7528_000415 [Penicillium herquei]
MENGEPILGSLYIYAPNRIAPIVFAAVFTISFIGHVYQSHRFGAWGLTGLQAFCALFYVVGYALRAYDAWGHYLYDEYASDSQTVLLTYIMSQVFVYVPPPLLELSNYHTLSRVFFYIPYSTPIAPRKIFIIFGSLMSLVEIFNGLGVAFSSNAKGSEQSAGRILVLTSLSIQICVILSFFVITTIFWYRCAKNNIRNQAVPKLFFVLFSSMVLIFIRCIYRLVEHVGKTTIDFTNIQEENQDSPLDRYEWYFWVFEGVTMLANSLLWNLFNPGRYLPRSTETWIGLDGLEIGIPRTEKPTGAQSPIRLILNLVSLGMWNFMFPKTYDSRPEEITTRDVTPYVASPTFQIRTNAAALGEAVEYYNTCIYPEISNLLGLGHNINVCPISPQTFALTAERPDYLRYGFVCMVLMHRTNRLRGIDLDIDALNHEFLHFRGVVIRSLLEAMSVEHLRASNTVIAGTLNLLLLEAHQGSTPHWRFHLKGLQQLMALRGGARGVAQAAGAESILPTFAHTTVLSDSTSPASDMMISKMNIEDFEFIVEEYGERNGAFASFPPELFREVVNINHLRSRATQELTLMSTLTSEAYQTLTRIHMFGPQVWASNRPRGMEEWTLLARLNQAAIALYCILSLQSVSILPDTPSLRNSRSTLAGLVKTHLDEAMRSPRSRRSLTWYFVVLGVQAVHTGGNMREYVRTRLSELSHFSASYRPLAAKEILEEFWTSGLTTWDDCFDKPYALCPR